MSVPFRCRLDTCPLSYGYLHYQPSIPGNALLLALFSVLIPVQLYLLVRHRTYLFGLCLVTGILSEVIGYLGRILLHGDPFSKVYFLIYLICLTLGPTFMAAALYLCLARIVVVYGEGVSRIRPRTYACVFVACDVCSLVVQAVGGGIAAVAVYQPKIDEGTHIMVAGLAVQVVSLLIFMVLCAEFAWRVSRRKGELNLKYVDLYKSRRFQTFLYGLTLATLCIFTRSVFRIAELSGGFAGNLAQNQVSFMVLDGAMIIIASYTLTILHPGVGFNGRWAEASFPYRIRKHKMESGMVTAMELSGSGNDSREVMDEREAKTG